MVTPICMLIHAPTDHDLAEAVGQDLRKNRVQVQASPLLVYADQHQELAQAQQFNNAYFLLVLWTEAVLENDELQLVIRKFQKTARPVIVLYFSQDALPTSLEVLEVIDFRDSYQEGLKHLFQYMKFLCLPGPGTARAPPEKPAWRSLNRHRTRRSSS
ncbi:MAG: hypothetical protein HC915_00055 [Anaerolineae bacterium]|nr:hypothetical protein [Anaerolineae bacterium]